MKSEVVLIAKFYRPQDVFEWIRHYRRLGFDHIMIYDNDTEVANVSAIAKIFDNVSVIKLHGKINQCEIYNQHIDNNTEYDWMFFCDDDEYLWLDKNIYADVNSFLKTIPSFVKQYSVFWQYISYFNGEVPDNRDCRMTEDCIFTAAGEYLTHVKSFVHKDMRLIAARFSVPHNVDAPIFTYAGPIETPAIVRDVSHDPIKLYHYYRRSKQEHAEKMERNRIDADGKYKDFNEQNSYEADLKYVCLDRSIIGQ